MPKDHAVEALPPETEGFLRERIDLVLERLPDAYRVPPVLHYLQGLDLETIAGQLGIAGVTVAWRLNKGREQARRLGRIEATSDWRHSPRWQERSAWLLPPPLRVSPAAPSQEPRFGRKSALASAAGATALAAGSHAIPLVVGVGVACAVSLVFSLRPPARPQRPTAAGRACPQSSPSPSPQMVMTTPLSPSRHHQRWPRGGMHFGGRPIPIQACGCEREGATRSCHGRSAARVGSARSARACRSADSSRICPVASVRIPRIQRPSIGGMMHATFRDSAAKMRPPPPRSAGDWPAQVRKRFTEIGPRRVGGVDEELGDRARRPRARSRGRASMTPAAERYRLDARGEGRDRLSASASARARHGKLARLHPTFTLHHTSRIS